MTAQSFEEWYDLATPAQRHDLISKLGGPSIRVSLLALRTPDSKPHHRKASAARASRIETAIAELQRYDKSIPDLTRGHICPTCSQCPYWLKSQDNND